MTDKIWQQRKNDSKEIIIIIIIIIINRNAAAAAAVVVKANFKTFFGIKGNYELNSLPSYNRHVNYITSHCEEIETKILDPFWCRLWK
jgi:hypothetical protein